MADIEKTPVIQFRTDDSGLMKGVTSIKELKTAIAQLRDEEVRLRQAGEDTTKVTTELQAAQRELNTVMGLTKKGVDGVEGSYDSLVAKLREAKTAWRALPQFINGELNPAWEKARQQVEQYNSKLKELDKSVGDNQRNVGNYQSALDGFSGKMGQAAQIGGQFNNGIAAMSNMMAMAGVSTEGMSDAMKGLQIAVGALNGLKGFGGLVKGIIDYVKTTAKSVAAAKADSAAKKENAAATTAMATAEGGATVATSALKIALDALGIGLIVGAVSLLVTHLQDVANWIGKLAEKLGIVKKQSREWEGANERLTNRFEEQNRELQLQQKVLAAQGKTKKELLEQQKAQIQLQINETKATIANIEARVKQMQADSGWVRFWKGENRQIKKAQEEIEALTESLKGMYQNMEEVNVDIKVEEITVENDKRKAAAQASAAALKAIDDAAKKAQANIDKILDSNITGVEKIKKEYEELFKQLDADEAALKKKAEKDNKEYDGSVIASARAVLEQQQTEKLRAEYKKQFDDLYNGYKSRQEVLRKDFDETKEVYDGLIPVLKNNFEERDKLYKENIEIRKKRVEDDIKMVKDTLFGVIGLEQVPEYVEFINKTPAELEEMYLDMLEDEKEFAKSFPEPFITALKEIGPHLIQAASDNKSDMKRFVNDLMSAYEEAVDKGDLKAVEKLRKRLLGEPPVADDEELRFAAEDFVKRMDKQVASQLAESDNPLAAYLSGTTWGEVFASQNEKWFKILDDGTATWRQHWEARANIISNFAEKYNKFLSTYGASTTNVLSSTANLWNAVIDAKQKDIDKQKEQGKISDKEYKRRTEENKKSFDNLKNLQIGTAIINTAAAVVAALADMSVPFYVRLANSVAAGITGAAEVVKIKSTDFGGGGSYEASSAPSITQSAPMVNTYGINPADYAEANAANPVRVYVVESDITEAQNAARTRVAESTF